MTYRNTPGAGARLTCGGVAALSIVLAPTLFFGLGSFLNWLL